MRTLADNWTSVSSLVGALKTCPGLRDTLLGGLATASHAPDATAKAWALRHAFDRVLVAIDAAVKLADDASRGDGGAEERQSHRSHG